MFEIKNVSKKYAEETILRDISMKIGKGLNFIIGSSGSGKTTLLKIMSGLEQSFEGDVLYCGKSIKDLKEEEKSYFYHNIFGFVWQDFNLLEDRTVLENVMLSQYLNEKQDQKMAMKLLRELKISELAQQRAGKLSGGQKQRVAIARELMKNPQVLFADEPTSALDAKTSKAIMDILRDISKSRMVIVVTHDTSFMDDRSKIYELDKGELMAIPDEVPDKVKTLDTRRPHKLFLKNALKLAKNNMKSKYARLAITVTSVLVAATLLLVTMSGAVSDSSQSAFDELFDTYGESILDLSVVDSFIGASGTDDADKEKPNTDVTQDIQGLYEKYLEDERVSHIVSIQAFNDIQITLDGKEYKIDTSNTVPTVNQIIAGTMPMGDSHEVVVPQSFAQKSGLTKEEILGKKISFAGTIFNWSTGEPVAVPVHTDAKVVGVVDTTVKYEYEGKIMEYSVDDSFFFSKSALNEMKIQSKMEKTVSDFTIRTKTPADLIEIKDELNAEGIVPLGQFQLVEDMVRLNNQTKEQSGSAVIVIGILSVVVALSVSLMTAISRKREYAIYRVSGYSSRNLALLTIAETLLYSGMTVILFLVTSPILNLATTALWKVTILNGKLLSIGVLLVMVTGAFTGFMTMVIATTTKAIKTLATGEK
ncbi:MAG: ABC transporter ATP-binding protein [Lachnospiraceae bacterium]